MAYTSKQLHNSIMRRVYYQFALRQVTSPVTIQFALLALALAIFAKLVFVRAVIDNLLNTKLASVPHFIVSALMQGETLTLIALGVIVFTCLSLSWRVGSFLMPSLRPVLLSV